MFRQGDGPSQWSCAGEADRGRLCRPGRLDVDRRLRRRPRPGAASLLLRNRDQDFPDWQGRDLTTRDPTARLQLLASDGATTATVAHQQLSRLCWLGTAPTLATLTMGGNDLLAAYGDAVAARRAIQTVVAGGQVVLAGLRALLDPDAPIVVGTVYDPSDGSGDAARLGLPPWP